MVLTLLNEKNPRTDAMSAGSPAPIYASVAPLDANGVYTTANGWMRAHLEDVAPAAGDWIEWGVANAIRVRITADQASATDGILVEESDDAISQVSELIEANLAANTPYDSAYAIKKHRYFRFSLTNGAVAQASLNLLVELIAELYQETPTFAS